MYIIFALFTGGLISSLVVFNGQLAQSTGLFLSAVIIHFVGVALSLVFMVLGIMKFRWKKGLPLWMYLGGVIGVAATFLNNYAFNYISVTNIVALGLLAQMVFSLVIDQLGLFGMQKRPIPFLAAGGVALAFVGIYVMLDFSQLDAILSIICSFAAGMSLVMVRTVNARLGQQIGQLESAFVHHLVGGIFSTILLLLFAANQISSATLPKSLFPYLGGVFGLFVILLFNLVVPHLSSFLVTILSFLGQIAGSLALDYILGSPWNKSVLIGSALLAVGIVWTQLAAARSKNAADR